MSDGVRIEEVVLKIGDKKITLSVEEARELKTKLNDLFGREVIREIVYKDKWYWEYPRPFEPIWVDTSKPNFHLCPTVVCDSDSSRLTITI